MRCKVIVFVVMLLFQFGWTGIVNCSLVDITRYAINFDYDFDDVALYWSNSTWNPSTEPADYWMKPENGIVTLYYKANRTDWGNTEVFQGKKPAFEVGKSLRFRDFRYKEGSGGLRLLAKVRRDIDPAWQGSALSDKSPYPQANIGVYLWLEVKGWNYDDWNTTSSLVIDFYFDSRYQDPNTNETKIWEVGGSYDPTTTPYDPQIHTGYFVGTLPLDSWQEFDVDVDGLIDQTLQKCRDSPLQLPSNEVCIKFFGVYVDSFSAAVQASFDYVLLKDTSYEELLSSFNELKLEHQSLQEDYINSSDKINELISENESLQLQIENIRNWMYTFTITTVAFMATTLYFVTRRHKVKL